MIGRTADVTVVQRTLTDTLYEQGKPQKVTAERQRAISKHLHGKLTERGKCVGKMRTSNWENLSGHQEPPCTDVFRKWLQVLHFYYPATPEPGRATEADWRGKERDHCLVVQRFYTSVWWQAFWRAWFPSPLGLCTSSQCLKLLVTGLRYCRRKMRNTDVSTAAPPSPGLQHHP